MNLVKGRPPRGIRAAVCLRLTISATVIWLIKVAGLPQTRINKK